MAAAKRVNASDVNAKVDALAEQVAALIGAISAPAEDTAKVAKGKRAASKPKAEAKVETLPDAIVSREAKLGLTVQPQYPHKVTMYRVNEDGAPVMSTKTPTLFAKPWRFTPAEIAFIREADQAQLDALCEHVA